MTINGLPKSPPLIIICIGIVLAILAFDSPIVSIGAAGVIVLSRCIGSVGGGLILAMTGSNTLSGKKEPGFSVVVIRFAGILDFGINSS